MLFSCLSFVTEAPVENLKVKKERYFSFPTFASSQIPSHLVLSLQNSSSPPFPRFKGLPLMAAAFTVESALCMGVFSSLAWLSH